MLNTKRLRTLTLCLGALVLMLWLNYPEFRKWTQPRDEFVYKDYMTTKSTNRLDIPQFQPSSDVKVLSHQRIILIIAYMRTGSSLTGSVLQKYPGTFYLFEPIRIVWDMFENAVNNSDIKLSYPNGSVRIYEKGDKDSLALDEVKSWMTCELNRLSMNSLMDRFQRRNSYLMKGFHACVERNMEHGTLEYRNLEHSVFRSCIQNISESCREAPLLILKLIRMPMSMIKALFPLFPNLKVIHLNRDPRGIFNSRSNLRDSEERTTATEVQKHCQRWGQDLATSTELEMQFPNRLQKIRYEYITEAPYSAFKKLSNFLGIPFTKEMVNYVASMTSALTDGCQFCKWRKNSTLTALKWRSQLNFTFAKYIYNTCKRGNKILNYRRFRNEYEMRNLSIPFYS